MVAGQKTGPSLGCRRPQQAWVHPVPRPHSRRLSRLPYRGSSRGACTWARAVSPRTPAQWLEQERRLRPPEACTGGPNLFPMFKTKEAAEPLGWAVLSWAWVAEPSSGLHGKWLSPAH